LTMRPWWPAIFGSITLGAERLEPAERPFFVRPDQARTARYIGREDRGDPTFDATWPCGLHGASSVADDPTPTSAPRTLSKEADTPEAKKDAPDWRAWLLDSPMSWPTSVWMICLPPDGQQLAESPSARTREVSSWH
jgi:hypothetical protein